METMRSVSSKDAQRSIAHLHRRSAVIVMYRAMSTLLLLAVTPTSQKRATSAELRNRCDAPASTADANRCC